MTFAGERVGNALLCLGSGLNNRKSLPRDSDGFEPLEGYFKPMDGYFQATIEDSDDSGTEELIRQKKAEARKKAVTRSPHRIPVTPLLSSGPVVRDHAKNNDEVFILGTTVNKASMGEEFGGPNIRDEFHQDDRMGVYSPEESIFEMSNHKTDHSPSHLVLSRLSFSTPMSGEITASKSIHGGESEEEPVKDDQISDKEIIQSNTTMTSIGREMRPPRRRGRPPKSRASEVESQESIHQSKTDAKMASMNIRGRRRPRGRPSGQRGIASKLSLEISDSEDDSDSKRILEELSLGTPSKFLSLNILKPRSQDTAALREEEPNTDKVKPPDKTGYPRQKKKVGRKSVTFKESGSRESEQSPLMAIPSQSFQTRAIDEIYQGDRSVGMDSVQKDPDLSVVNMGQDMSADDNGSDSLSESMVKNVNRDISKTKKNTKSKTRTIKTKRRMNLDTPHKSDLWFVPDKNFLSSSLRSHSRNLRSRRSNVGKGEMSTSDGGSHGEHQGSKNSGGHQESRDSDGHRSGGEHQKSRSSEDDFDMPRIKRRRQYSSSSSDGSQDERQRSDEEDAENGDLDITVTPGGRTYRRFKVVRPNNHTPGVRRSQRARIAPVNVLENEQVEYDTRRRSGITMKGILVPYGGEKRSKKKRGRPKKTTIINDDSFPPLSFEDRMGGVKTQKIIYTLESSRRVDGMGQEISDDGTDVVIYKLYADGSVSNGIISFSPLGEKACCSTGSHNMCFFVMKGKLLFNINEEDYEVSAGQATVLVPSGVYYYIRNLLPSKAEVFFCCHTSHVDYIPLPQEQ